MNAALRCALPPPSPELSLPSSRSDSPAPESFDTNLCQGRWTQEQFDAMKARNVHTANTSVLAQMQFQIRAAENKMHGTRAQMMVCATMVDQLRASIKLHQQHIEQQQLLFAQQMELHQAHIAQHESAMSDMQAHMANLSMMEREQSAAVETTKRQAAAVMEAVTASAPPATPDDTDFADAPLMPAPEAAPMLVPIENGEAVPIHDKPVTEALTVLVASEDAAGQFADDEGENLRPRRRAGRSKRGGWRVRQAQERARANIEYEIERIFTTSHMQRALAVAEETSES